MAWIRQFAQDTPFELADWPNGGQVALPASLPSVDEVLFRLRATGELTARDVDTPGTRPVIVPSRAALWINPSRRPRLTQKNGTPYCSGCSGMPRRRRAMFSAAHAPARRVTVRTGP